MKFDIEKLIAKHTDGETVDFTKINEALDTQNKNIVAKEVTKEAKKFDKDTVIKEFLTEHEFKTLDEFTTFKKNGATVDSEAVKRVEKLLDEANGKLKDLPTLQSRLSTYENQALLSGNATLTKDELEFYEYKISKLDGETFEDKYNSFIEASPDVFTAKASPNVISTTGATTGTTLKQGEKAGFEKILEEKYPNLK